MDWIPHLVRLYDPFGHFVDSRMKERSSTMILFRSLYFAYRGLPSVDLGDEVPNKQRARVYLGSESNGSSQVSRVSSQYY